jgi:hypothetical protein
MQKAYLILLSFLLCASPAVADGFYLTPVPAGPPVGAAGWNARRGPALAALCKFEDNFGNHLTEDGTDTALAKLVDPSCGRCPTCSSLPFEPGPGKSMGNVDLVNAWIQSISEVGEVGTDLSTEADIANATMDSVLAAVAVHTILGIPIPSALEGAVLPTTVLLGALALSQPDEPQCRTVYDYDMGLIGLLRILYLYGPPTPGTGPVVSSITKATLDFAIKHLLTQTGGADEWRDHPHLCAISLPVPETENHIWMTESSRYLSNQLIRAQTNPLKIDAIDKITKYRYVNDKNGLKDKLLERMANVLAGDFHEYNARPYARLTAKALENLRDFAEDREIRRGAKMVLDYVSAKFATSSSVSRRSVPFRRLTENENKTNLLWDVADEETWRFIQLTGAVSVLEHDQSGNLPFRAAGPMLVTSTSVYRVPALIEDLIAKPDDRDAFFQRYKHEAYEVYYGHPSFLISAGGVFRPGWDPDHWDHIGIDAAMTAITGNPVLGPLLGETVGISLVNGIVEKEASSALPTVLIPTAHGTDRNNLIRIDGSADRKLRNNTCVYGPGFACGLNPYLPPGFEKCTKHHGENWSFVDLADTGDTCENDGIFVVFWRSQCDDSDCSDRAGGDRPGYGFFEVIEKTHDITLGKVMYTTLANNGGRLFPSRLASTYTTFGGTDIHFAADAPVDSWGILDPTIGDMKGDIVNNLYPGNNDWRKSCVEVDNAFQSKRLILDFHDPKAPRWCEIPIKDPIKYGCAREPCPKSDID